MAASDLEALVEAQMAPAVARLEDRTQALRVMRTVLAELIPKLDRPTSAEAPMSVSLKEETSGHRPAFYLFCLCFRHATITLDEDGLLIYSDSNGAYSQVPAFNESTDNIADAINTYMTSVRQLWAA